MYGKALAILEAADARAGKARYIAYPLGSPRETWMHSQRVYWTEKRVEDWQAADAQASAIADQAVADSPAVKTATALADRARARGTPRELAKAAAARCAMRQAIWLEAYGRAMPKEYRRDR